MYDPQIQKCLLSVRQRRFRLDLFKYIGLVIFGCGGALLIYFVIQRLSGVIPSPALEPSALTGIIGGNLMLVVSMGGIRTCEETEGRLKRELDNAYYSQSAKSVQATSRIDVEEVERLSAEIDRSVISIGIA